MDDDEGGSAAEAVAAATAGELRLLDPAVRADPELVHELLDGEFQEFGASGQYWDAASVTELLKRETPELEGSVTVRGTVRKLVAPGVVHLTYLAERDGRKSRRSSLWRHDPGGWRLYFHQGTAVPE